MEQEFGEFWPQERLGGMFAAVDPDRPRRLFLEFAERVDLRGDIVEMGPDIAEQPFACLGWGDAARGAGEQAQPQPFLQPADRMAECGLRHAELRRSPREAPLPRNGEESDEVIDVGPRHS